MGKGTKIAYSVAAILLLVGIGLIAAALIATGGDFSKLGTAGSYTEKTYDAPGADINSVYIEASNKPIRLTQSEDGIIRITYYESERESYTLSLSNGDLSLKYKTDRSLAGLFSLDFNTADYAVQIELPKDFRGKIELLTDNGGITLDCENTFESVRLDTSNGKISVKNAAVTGELSVKTSNGTVTLENLRAESITARLSNGSVRLTGIHAQTIYLKTSNGSISGSVAGNMGDYKIISGTSNGKSNLPSEKADGSKSLTALTSNGSIDIAFIN